MSFLYKLYTGDETNLGSVDTIEDETYESEGTDVTKLSTTEPKAPGENVPCNVLAEHIATGKKAVFDVLIVRTDDPEIEEITRSPISINNDPYEVISCSWEVISDSTTPEQEEVTVTSLNEDIVTISNVDQSAKTFDATLRLVESGSANETQIRIRSDYDSNVEVFIDVIVKIYEEHTQYESEVNYTTA